MPQWPGGRAPLRAQPDLHAAARGGNTATAAAALPAGATIDEPDHWGRTPLIVALQQGRVALADPRVQARIDADFAEAGRFQFDSVPAYVIDGRAVRGAQPASRFFGIIDAALRR